ADGAALDLGLARNLSGEDGIIKSIKGHWRLQTKADILKRYQSKKKKPFLRPLVDEIVEPADPPSIVLRHLDSDCLTESNKKRLSRPEIKQVALNDFHKDGIVHTDVKLDNIFVNYGRGDQRFSEVQLGDCGGAVSQKSRFAIEGHLIGAGFTRSPEATLQLSWTTATDIWSFGSAMLSLIYGGGYHLFNPQIDAIKPGHEDYEFTALKRMHKFFGPFPHSYHHDIKDSGVSLVINVINGQGPPAKPFIRVTTKEIAPADKEFILKILKLDPRNRPTAEELLADTWFTEESPDTREPLPEEVKQLGEA
ncbi:hypothetical protein RB600_009474, partial [Gaeumannomyces tritici]